MNALGAQTLPVNGCKLCCVSAYLQKNPLAAAHLSRANGGALPLLRLLASPAPDDGAANVCDLM